MTSAHINIGNEGDRLSGELRRFVEQLQQVQDKAEKIKATYDQIALDSDWESLATALNLDPVAQLQDAEDIYNLIGSVQTELNATFINQLLGRLG